MSSNAAATTSSSSVISSVSSASSASAPAATWIPSIAGWEKKSWKAFTQDCPTLAPGSTGSFGVHFDTNENMSDIYAKFAGDRDAIFNYLTKTRKSDYHAGSRVSEPRPEHLHSSRAHQLMAFYEFAADAKQPLFYLRCAADTLCLCRKTTGYTYVPERFTATKGTVAMHRVSFEVVRAVTQEESKELAANVKRVNSDKPTRITGIPYTFYTAPLLPLPAPPVQPPAVQDLDAVMARLTALRAELASITDALSSTIATLRV